jgi:hypothetical protein
MALPIDTSGLDDATRRAFDQLAQNLGPIREQIRFGTGSPESVVTAGPSTIYLRVDAPDADHASYFKGTGTAATGWKRLTSTGYAAA